MWPSLSYQTLVSPLGHFVFQLGQPNRRVQPSVNFLVSSQVDIYCGLVIVYQCHNTNSGQSFLQFSSVAAAQDYMFNKLNVQLEKYPFRGCFSRPEKLCRSCAYFQIQLQRLNLPSVFPRRKHFFVTFSLLCLFNVSSLES